MTWEAGTYYAAICDRCSQELEDPDTGGAPLFKAGETTTRLEEYWGWHEVRREADGAVQLICVECWDELRAEGAPVVRETDDRTRFEQTGPDLLGGGS